MPARLTKVAVDEILQQELVDVCAVAFAREGPNIAGERGGQTRRIILTNLVL